MDTTDTTTTITDDSDVDDMAFLDAQIEGVQNSHGRTLMGKKGTNYRTIVNGILNSPTEKRSNTNDNTKAASALQSKLRTAQNTRKPQPKKKKKKK
mmetsp:Transcript_21419/g.23760  ORF Transcript_21419/g.23760 Transcript_21419/m.23760 type:complete len:96 (+) Transcript_21419:2-289(+)